MTTTIARHEGRWVVDGDDRFLFSLAAAQSAAVLTCDTKYTTY